ncbi:hypothetical protein [Sphingobium olei]|uniref:Integral membrane protein n=1 Tax=Sphingobium olei TaxID=420955 RepID=A0ABW3NWX0_9SPHN
MDNFTSFAVAMAVVLVISAASRNSRLEREAAALGAIWAGLACFVAATEIYEPWHISMVVDLIAAAWLAGITWRGEHVNPGWRRPILSILFCVQVSMHAAYGLMEMFTRSTNWQRYYDELSTVGWLQLALVGGWGVAEILWRAAVRAWAGLSLLHRKKALGDSHGT